MTRHTVAVPPGAIRSGDGESATKGRLGEKGDAERRRRITEAQGERDVVVEMEPPAERDHRVERLARVEAEADPRFGERRPPRGEPHVPLEGERDHRSFEPFAGQIEAAADADAVVDRSQEA